MPLPIPTEIINAAEHQDRLDRLSEWPEFRWTQKLKFWRDRIVQNKSIKANSPSFTLANVAIPAKRTLILGEYIRGHNNKYSGRDLFYALAREWSRIGEVKVHNNNWPGSAFVINPALEGCNRALVTSSRNIAAYNELSHHFKEDIITWLIGNCDRELADVISEETGYPANYFYAIPSYHFWVYTKEDRKLILAAIENKNSFFGRLKRFFRAISRQSKLVFLAIVVLHFLPMSIYTSLGLFLILPLLTICLAKDYLRYLQYGSF